MRKRYKTAGRKRKPSRRAARSRRSGPSGTGRSGPETDLLRIAESARTRAYAPYSKFTVGAVVRAGSGRIYAGCNVENAFYEAAHAEQAAVIAAISAGERIIEAVAIVGGPKGKRPGNAVPPCGFCRQWIFEFAPRRGDVTILGRAGRRTKRWSLRKLLPDAFGPDALAGNR